MKVLALVCLAAAVVGFVYASNQCGKALDLVLVVEDTDYLGNADNENDLREFLAAIVNWLKIGSTYGPPNPYDQAAYVLYNATGTNVFFLTKYTESSDARSAVLGTKFSKTTHDGALIHEGLNFAWNESLRVGNGERSCYPTVIVLVSYSKYPDPNKFGDAKSDAEKADLSASRNLQNSDALVIVVGVGPNRNPDHLRKVATSPSYYYDYADFSDLTQDEGVKVATAACSYTQTGEFYPCEMQTQQADITFVVDTSVAFTQPYANDILAFMKNLMTPYTYDSNTGIQAALVTYAKTANADIRFDDSRNGDLQSFLNAVNTTFQTALTCASCRTDNRCIYSALEQVNSAVLDPAHGMRTVCAVHYIYVFSAGCFGCENSIDDPVPLAGTIRASKNAEIFVVNLAAQPSPPAPGVGFAFWKEPLEISDNYSHLWEAQLDPDSILPNYLHKQAWRTMCISRIPIDLACPAVTTTAGPATTTSAAATTTTPPPGK